MYLVNTLALREELRTNRVSEYDKMKYLLVFSIFIPRLSYSICADDPVVQTVDTLVTLVLIVTGIVLCYKANGLRNGHKFLERFICLSWPVWVIVNLILWPPGILLAWSFPFKWFSTLFVAVWFSMFFLGVRSELLKLSGTRESSIPAPNP